MGYLFPPAPSTAVLVTFPLLTAAVAATAVVVVHRAALASGADEATAARLRLRTAVALSSWLALTGALAAAGLLARFDVLPPPLVALVVPVAVAMVVVAFSPFGSMVARHTPIAVLVGFQAFRLPLEAMLHQLSWDGVLPVQMTWDGMNFDVATGATAVVVALWAAYGRVPRPVLVAWNAMGLALLWTIVTIALLSAPVPFRVFWNEPANTVVTTFPFVWLPSVLVQLAWLGHLLLLRRLAER